MQRYKDIVTDLPFFAVNNGLPLSESEFSLICSGVRFFNDKHDSDVKKKFLHSSLQIIDEKLKINPCYDNYIARGRLHYLNNEIGEALYDYYKSWQLNSDAIDYIELYLNLSSKSFFEEIKKISGDKKQELIVHYFLLLPTLSRLTPQIHRDEETLKEIVKYLLNLVKDDKRIIELYKSFSDPKSFFVSNKIPKDIVNCVAEKYVDIASLSKVFGVFSPKEGKKIEVKVEMEKEASCFCTIF